MHLASSWGPGPLHQHSHPTPSSPRPQSLTHVTTVLTYLLLLAAPQSIDCQLITSTASSHTPYQQVQPTPQQPLQSDQHHRQLWTASKGPDLPPLLGPEKAEQLRTRAPKVYIYDLPSFRTNYEAWMNTSLYGLEINLPLILKDSPYVTTDPEQADFFYVWAWPYYTSQKCTQCIVQLMQAAGPWWDRRNGTDHIWTLTHDMGLCDSHPQRELLFNSIILEHWGKVMGSYAHNPCPLYDFWAEECDPFFVIARDKDNPPQPCYTRGKDLVVPSVVSEDPTRNPFLMAEFNATGRTTLLLFAGAINTTHLTNADTPESDAGYSFGVRQALARMFEHYPGFRVFAQIHHQKYWGEVRAATFCLAPAGWGWGARFKSAVTHGCIPVVVQDGIKVEWEDQLPMAEFAIRIPFMYMHRLPELLAKFQRLGRVERFQRNLACIWPLYWWSRPQGRAFEMTLCALKSHALRKNIQVDFGTCTINCGDGKYVKIQDMHFVA